MAACPSGAPSSVI